MELGRKQTLRVVMEVEFGVYLGTEEDKVLLPAKQVPEGTRQGSEIEVFVYRDSDDRLIATTHEPKITLYEIQLLKVVEVTKIGAFLDWGLEKDLLLPFKEQTKELHEGEKCLVALYIDKSDRLCATMKLYHYLRTDSPYEREQEVTGRVYEISGNFGTFVAVDDCYSGLIPQKQMYGARQPQVGEIIQARVTGIKADGKLDLSVREKAYLQMDDDAEKIYQLIEQEGGRLPFNDKADPETIKEATGMSKNEFKRAVGRLYKERKIKILPDCIMKL